jgi:hypothetical protein
MNKQERKLKGQAKFKKRLKNYGIIQDIFDNGWGNNPRNKLINFNCYRTTGKPCSCIMCSPGKIEEKAKYRFNKFDKKLTDE